MIQRVFSSADMAVPTRAAHVVWLGDAVAPVQQDLDDLVVVPLGGQDDGRDVGGERAGGDAAEESLKHGGTEARRGLGGYTRI
jgi:hypothetical protein